MPENELEKVTPGAMCIVKPKRTCNKQKISELERKKSKSCDVPECTARDSQRILQLKIESYRRCIDLRNRITNECYGGKKHDGHEDQIDQKNSQILKCQGILRRQYGIWWY